MTTSAPDPRTPLPARARIAAALDDTLYRLVRLVTRPSRSLRRRLEHSPITGRLVALRGDVVSVEGLRFSVHSPAISPAAKAPFVFGSYESAERRLLRAHLDPTNAVLELGASIGVVSCLVNRRLRDPAQHLVVEANPSLLPLLHANRDRNGCAFEIVHAALAYGAGEVEFGAAAEFTASRTRQPGDPDRVTAHMGVRVRARTLGQLITGIGMDRCTLICDVEGAEWDMVEHDADVLRARVATLVIELHPHPSSGRPIAELAARIAAAGFRELDRRGETYVFASQARPPQR